VHDEFFAPVLRVPVSDVDRRMLRQILNKLKGKHSGELDSAEYMRIIEAGEKDDLAALLSAVGEKLPEPVCSGSVFFGFAIFRLHVVLGKRPCKGIFKLPVLSSQKSQVLTSKS